MSTPRHDGPRAVDVPCSDDSQCPDDPQCAVEPMAEVSQRQLDEHEARLDSLTRLACKVFGVSMSTIGVSSEGVDYFVSEQGLGMHANAGEESICQWVHSTGGPVVIADTWQDDRVLALPAVAAGMVRFYAGAPLRDRGGNIIGTLCVYSGEPRAVDGDELGLLEDLAVWAEHEVAELGEGLRARRVQSSLLPDGPLQVEGWSVAGSCTPALHLGGDFFDYRLTESGLHLLLGDVMGKGAGAALLGAGVRSALRSAVSGAAEGDHGATITDSARDLLADLERADSLVTLMSMLVDPRTGTLRYVDAGLGYCVYLGPDGRREVLSAAERPLGVFADDVWTEQERVCAPGGRLLVFSDGLLDLLDDPDDWEAEVGGLLASHDSADDVVAAVDELGRRRRSYDDVTVVALYRSAR